MALQSLNTAISWPGMIGLINGGAPSLGAGITIDAAGEYIAYIGVAREAMTISHVGFRTSTATASPTADVRIETVAADGTPSGTLWAANTNIVTAVLSANTFALHALTASASITKGATYCVKIVFNSGTSFQVTSATRLSNYAMALPYQVVNTGTPTKGLIASAWLIALGSDATHYYSVPGLLPVTTLTNNTFNNTSSAARGMRFQVPFKCRVAGMSAYLNGALGDVTVSIMDDAGAILNSSDTAFDGDQNQSSTQGAVSWMFDNASTLSPGTWYRAVITPSSATNTNITTLTFPTAAYRQAFPSGENCHYATYVASAWTDTATDQIPLIDILIDQLDDGVSTGSAAGVIGS